MRHSLSYRILSVIDSVSAGLDVGEVLDNKANGIPILANAGRRAIIHAESIPDYFIFGIAPSTSGFFSSDLDKSIILNAIVTRNEHRKWLKNKFLTDDPLFLEASLKNNVRIFDTRKPKSKEGSENV
ncbi:DUF1611 domain-containing protein [Vibrio lentus]